MKLYILFTFIGIVAAFITAKFVGVKRPKGETLLDMYIVGAIGLIIGVKFPVFILYGISYNTILTGKSVMGGLLGIFVAMHLYKFFSKRKKEALGGSFAVPFAVGLGFGKIGCYFNGCCGGDFFIPIQLIESAAQFVVGGLLYIFYKRTQRADLLFPLYMLSYLILRFLAEFIRTPEKLFYGFTLYQWLAVIFLPVVCYIIFKRLKNEYTNAV